MKNVNKKGKWYGQNVKIIAENDEYFVIKLENGIQHKVLKMRVKMPPRTNINKKAK